MQLISGGSVLFAALLASTASAQQVGRLAPIPGAVKNAGTYHVATGTWTRAQQTYGIIGDNAVYRNDLASGYFGLLDQGEIAFDEGRLPSLGAPLVPPGGPTGTSDAYNITGFQFGYCALNATPTTYTLEFREAYAPCNNPAGFPVAASFVTTGLPNGGCWIVAFDLTGTTDVFTLVADADGTWDNNNDLDDFGYSLNLNHGQGNGTGQVVAGPILTGRTDQPLTFGEGTIWKNPTAMGTGTGLGSEDLFWLQSPVVAAGCYFYGGCVPCANFQVTFYGEDADAITSYCDPGNDNSLPGTGGAVLSHNGGFGTASASFTVSNVPNQPGILYAGPNQLDIPFGCGRRCVGGQVARYAPVFPMNNTVTTSINMTLLAGLNNVQYWYRDPAFGGCGGQFFNLSNALTNQ